jgi:hypothetical protein
MKGSQMPKLKERDCFFWPRQDKRDSVLPCHILYIQTGDLWSICEDKAI